MKKKILFVLILFLVTVFQYSKNVDESKRGIFINSFLVLPYITVDLYCFTGLGLGFNLNSKIEIQLNGIFKKYEEREKGFFPTSLRSIFFDFKYKFSRKRLRPYLLLSEGLIFLNSKRIYRSRYGRSYEEKDRRFDFCIGGGIGVNITLNKIVRVFFESRVYLLLEQGYEKTYVGGLIPITAGISLKI